MLKYTATKGIVLTDLLNLLKEQAAKLKRHTLTIYFAAKDPEMPLLPRLLAILIVAYALSPIDLIPDFIPIIGYLDDLVIVPLGLALVLRLTPQHIIETAKLRAEKEAEKPVNYYAAAVFVTIWLVLLVYLLSYLKQALGTH